MTPTSVGPSSQRSSRYDYLLYDLGWLLSVVPNLQPTLPTNVERLMVQRTIATFDSTDLIQNMLTRFYAADVAAVHATSGRHRSLLERVVHVWALEKDEADRLVNLCERDAAAASNLATATDMLIRYLKQDRIAGVVRRPIPALDGTTLLELLLKGDSESVMKVCQDMFRFDDVYA